MHMATKRAVKLKSVGVRLEQVDQVEGVRLIRTKYVLIDDRSSATESFTSLDAAEKAYHEAVASRE
jgi:hypothetical protein